MRVKSYASLNFNVFLDLDHISLLFCCRLKSLILILLILRTPWVVPFEEK